MVIIYKEEGVTIQNRLGEINIEIDKSERLLDWVLGVIKILLVSLTIAWLFSEFIMFKAYVPTGSMKPTIMEEDNIMISRVFMDINRGDIMVFKHDVSEEYLIKRVVGLPGDIVEIKDGITYINGELYTEAYVKNSSSTNNLFIVPENCYLFLGDNRAGSEDARMWKNPYVNKDSIVGKAMFRIYPFKTMGVMR